MDQSENKAGRLMPSKKPIDIARTFHEGVVPAKTSTVSIRSISNFIQDNIQTNPYYNKLAIRQEREEYTSFKIAHIISKDPLSVVMSVSAGKIQGVVISKFDCYTRWISWLITAPQIRRNGVAIQLLNAVKQIAMASGCHKIWCDTRTDNVESINLFKKLGYSCVANLDNHWYGQDFHLFELQLMKG